MAKANQRAGWRKSNTRAVAATTNEFGSRGRETRKLLFRVSMLSTLAIVLLALLVFVLYRTPDRDVPLILSVVSRSGARSSDDVLFTAPNPYAQEDVELLRAWFGGGEGDPSENVRLVGDPNDCSGVMDHETKTLITALTKPLATVKPGGPGGDMIALYVSAHGFVDRGTPFLAVGNSRADRESTWVRFQDLFDSVVKTLDERDDAGRGIKTVLFIDAARVGPQWDWGQFTESFGEAAARLTAGQADRVAVILSASPGQRSWWDPRKGKGLFTAALIEALTGKGDSNQDGTVTVGEIADYLASQVPQSAAATWDTNQTPMLVGTEARDWRFISQPVPVAAPATDPVNPDELRRDLQLVDELWQRHNALAGQTHPPLAFNPLGWATLEKKLSRLDALLLSGKGYRDQFQSMRSNCDGDLTRFETGPDTLPKESALPELALRDYFHGVEHELKTLNQDQLAAFQEMIVNWSNKPDIAAAVQIPMSESQAIRFLWSWLQQKNFDAESLSLAAELLERSDLVTSAQAAGLIESQFTRLLSARDLSHVTPSDVAILADSHQQSRRTLCTPDLRASFWIRDRFNILESQRLACLDRILSRNPDEQAVGRDRWRRDIKPGFESLAQSAAAISQAYLLRDQMLHAIPRTAETLMVDLEAFENQEQFQDSQSRVVIKRAIESLAKLAASLQLPRDDDTRPIQTLQQDIITAGADAQQAFDALNKRITDRLNEATAEKAGDARGLRQNYSLLIGTGTGNAVLRQRVHTRLCDLIADQSAGVGTVQSNQQADNSATSMAAALELMAIDGKHVWDHWLKASANLNQLPGADPSSETAENTPNGNPNDDSLNQLFQNTGVTFRKLVANLSAGQLAERVTAEDVMRDPITKSEQQSSLQSTRRELERWDTFIRARTMLFSHAPGQVERVGKGRFALDQQLFLFDHAARTMNEFWCEAREGDQPFFVDAANRLLASRNQNPLFPTLAMNLDGVNLSERLSQTAAAAASAATLKPQPGEKFRDGTLLKFVLGKDVQFVIERPDPVPPGYASFWSNRGDQSKTVRLDDPPVPQIDVPMFVSDKMLEDEASIDTGLFFRGMRRDGRILFKTIVDGKRTVFTLPNYTPPIARVVRETKQPERLLLVFDCSLSMRAATANGLSRLAVAQNAVSGFLDGLEGDVEVGLIVFGDRYGFEEKQNPTTGELQIFPVVEDGKSKLRVVNFVGREMKPAGLIVANDRVPHNPNFDVRVGVPINPLDDRQIRTLKKQIADLGAIGTTPTYRAIQKAYELLGRGRGHIIVLTDGKPKVITTPDVSVDDLRPAAIKSYQQRKDDVQLTIVQYLNADTELSSEFPGVTVLKAADGNDLLRHLQNVRSKPVVTWQRNREEASGKADFESLVAISQWPPTGVATLQGQPVLPAQPYAIRVQVPDSSQPVDVSSDVRVEGGEQFEMVFADRLLSHRPFNYQDTQLQTIPSTLTDGSRFKVSAGPISKRENQQLTMQLALESASGGQANGKFSPRPSDIWIELTGIDSRNTSRQANDTYLFSLPEYQVRQPIPILLCRIDGFLPRYDKVEVKAWLRFGDDRLAGSPIPLETEDAFTANGLAGVTFRTQRSVNESGGIRVTVTEQYSDQREPGSLRVLPLPLPNRAAISLYEKERVVTRTFDFDDAEAAISLSAIDSVEIKQQSSLSAAGTVLIDYD